MSTPPSHTALLALGPRRGPEPPRPARPLAFPRGQASRCPRLHSRELAARRVRRVPPGLTPGKSLGDCRQESGEEARVPSAHLRAAAAGTLGPGGRHLRWSPGWETRCRVSARREGRKERTSCRPRSPSPPPRYPGTPAQRPTCLLASHSRPRLLLHLDSRGCRHRSHSPAFAPPPATPPDPMPRARPDPEPASRCCRFPPCIFLLVRFYPFFPHSPSANTVRARGGQKRLPKQKHTHLNTHLLLSLYPVPEGKEPGNRDGWCIKRHLSRGRKVASWCALISLWDTVAHVCVFDLRGRGRTRPVEGGGAALRANVGVRR